MFLFYWLSFFLGVLVNRKKVRINNWELKKTGDYVTGVETLEEEEKGQVKLDTIENEKYLGDIISFDGKNKKNIIARKNKGIAILKLIEIILEGSYR